MIGGHAIAVQGRAIRAARLRDEGYDFVADARGFVAALGGLRPRIDLFTFSQPLTDTTPRYEWPMEWDQLSVVPLTSYEQWWKAQINDKTRNMVRRSTKKGVEYRPFALDGEAVVAIKTIYDESPLRQGRPFKHYRKPLDMIEREHATFAERSEFIGAYSQGRMIGFIKLVHQPGWSSLMQIIALLSERDKAPTNGLIAQAVQICAARGVPRLQYGIWSHRGIGEFKQHHGFEPLAVPRYHVPLSVAGRVALACGLHRPMTSRIPQTWLDRLAQWRGSWNGWRYARDWR